MELIERIQRIMDQTGLKKSQLAKRIGVSEGNVGDWFRGRSKPSIQVVITISKEFNVSTDWLLTGNECVITQSEEGKRLLEIFNTLDSERKSDLFKYLEYLVFLTKHQ